MNFMPLYHCMCTGKNHLKLTLSLKTICMSTELCSEHNLKN